jgi:hypothetical protein
METKADCNCTAKEPGATFPGVHATDCPEFIEAIQNRRVPRFDERENQAEREPLDFESFVEEFLGGILGPKPELPRFPGADHDLRDLPPTLTRTKVVNGNLVTGILTSSLTLLNDAIDSFGPGEEIDTTITVARDLIKLALDEITP